MTNPGPDSNRRPSSPAPDEKARPPGQAEPGPARKEKPFTSRPAAVNPTRETMERCLVELVRYYRHSGVGRRCRHLVHQMNTPLQVLSFQLELLEQKTREELQYLSQCPAEMAQPLQTLLAYRTDKFHQFRQELTDLQRFTRDLTVQGVHEDSQEQLYLDLNWICERELEFYVSHSASRQGVHLEVRLEKGLPPFYGYYIDFSQSIRNLVDNALEAMAEAEFRKLTLETRVQDHLVILRVGDTGEGIPPGNLARIFHPYFTTRGPGRAGLGLFMVRRLLAPYHADIRVDSRPGETWIHVGLPVA